MNAKRILMPAVVSLALLAGCDNEEKKPTVPAPTNPPTARPNQPAPKAPDATVTPDKAAVDKAAADKLAADKAAAEKVVADKLAADKAAADKLIADKAAAAKTAADAAKEQGTKLLGDLNTAITGGKWADADALIKQLDAMRDKLPADLQTKYDGLKKLYTDTKAKVPAIPGLPK